tara:strand:+ start:607 stop:1572 length:966 start_codon:yes stop_codon:yes gene_type:complete
MKKKYTKRKYVKKRKTKKNKKKKKTAKGGDPENKKIFIKDNCAPKKNSEVLDFTCYTNDALQKMKISWNKRHPDQKIIHTNPRLIWNDIKSYMRNTCNRESCWLKQTAINSGIDKNIMDYTFAPEIPLKWKDEPNTWLNSIDIGKVMKQYEKKYSNFQFIGPSPINWDTKEDKKCILEELCNFNLINYLKKRHTKIGIIFNLDPHYKSGSHWVMLFINCKLTTEKPDGEIYYFDSYGNNSEKVPASILRFVKKVQEQAIKLNKQYTFDYNTKRHQYGHSECGMYCLYMIIQLLKNKKFKELNSKRITDEGVWNCRKKYFNI